MSEQQATAGEAILPDLDQLQPWGRPARSGRVRAVKGAAVQTSLPEVHLGEVCAVARAGLPDLLAEVVAFDDRGAWLMPYGPLESVACDAEVTPAEIAPSVPCGDSVLGRVLDARGDPLDDQGPLAPSPRRPLYAEPPPPLSRRPLDRPLATGIPALDAFVPLAVGQRVCVAAAAGVGKSTLLGSLVRNVEADRIVVALIGERGREVSEFVFDTLDDAARRRTTVVVSTSDQSALLRMRAAYAATAIAEDARERGQHVVLLMDSITRFARALRELGHAIGEPTGRGGYPNSLFTRLPRLFERAGNDAHGSITAFYTVLAESDDLDDPVVEETISLLDGHVVLSRDIAKRRRFPAVDVVASTSRLAGAVTSDEHREIVRKVCSLLTEHERNYDKIKMGCYEAGGLDAEQIERRFEQVEEFLRLPLGERRTREETLARMRAEFGAW